MTFVHEVDYTSSAENEVASIQSVGAHVCHPSNFKIVCPSRIAHQRRTTVEPQPNSGNNADLDCSGDQIADVVNVYSAEVVNNHASPKETTARLQAILEFFGGMMLADINGKTCRDYVATRPRVPAARRQLEDLRAAISTTMPKAT